MTHRSIGGDGNAESDSGLEVAGVPVAGSESRDGVGEAALESALQASFEAAPLGDGSGHPAEKIIDEALQSGAGPSALGWLKAFCLDAARPGFAASVLRCLGRQADAGTADWRVALVRDGLATDGVEIRDAAVQAAEAWGDLGMVEVLESHREPVAWLREYIGSVIDDLAREQAKAEAKLQATLAEPSQCRDDSGSGNFWKSLTLEELARAQNVQPVADVQALFGTWPGEESDGFEAAVDELRHPGGPKKGQGA